MNFIHTPGAINFTEIMKIYTPGALLINFIRILFISNTTENFQSKEALELYSLILSYKLAKVADFTKFFNKGYLGLF